MWRRTASQLQQTLIRCQSDLTLTRPVSSSPRTRSTSSTSSFVVPSSLFSHQFSSETALSKGKKVKDVKPFGTNWVPCQVTSLRHSAGSMNASQHFCYSTTPEPTDKETSQAGDVEESAVSGSEKAEGVKSAVNGSEKAEGVKTNADGKTVASKQGEDTSEGTSSESDDDNDLSFDELVKLVSEKEELLKIKQKEVEAMQDKVLRSYADMENVMERTKREAENSKKYAIQNFAKSLLDVSDNLGRASSVVKESFSKIDTSKDEIGAVPLLKTLLEGVEMTEKQLAEVFRKYGLEKYEPLNEQFDPNKHFAIFQIPDESKPPGTVATVLKAGYMLHDRIIRPAEVGVIQAVEASQSS